MMSKDKDKKTIGQIGLTGPIPSGKKVKQYRPEKLVICANTIKSSAEKIEKAGECWKELSRILEKVESIPEEK